MKRPGALRIVYALMYSAAAVVNLMLALRSPGIVRGLSGYAYLPVLRRLISVLPDSVFTLALLSFAAYQIVLVTLLLNDRHYRLGFWGGILFHLGIIPFGPFNLLNLLIAAPLVLALRRDGLNRHASES